MASHPLNYEPYPEVAPQGGPMAREDIHSDADMFGGAIAKGIGQVGQGLEHASQEGFDVITQSAQMDASSHANELNAWFAKNTTDLSEKFYSLRGKDAEMQLPNYQDSIDTLRKSALSQAVNPATREMVDNNTRQITDSSYRAAARHAGEQKATWDQNSATEKAQSYGSLAAVHASSLPADAEIQANPNVALYLASSDGAAREAAMHKGLDGDIEAQKNRGRNVSQIIKALVADGSQTSLTRAWSFLGSQDSKIDPGSRATIEQALRQQTATFNGQTRADSYMGRGVTLPGGFTAPAGYIERGNQIESGGNPNAITGSNRGLGQWSPDLERRYGITDANRTDPSVQARAWAMEAHDNHDALVKVLGHEPTPSDYYLAHQQGIGGAVAHFSQPNLPAWQNMASTGEGLQKGAGWAKAAIWGNMTPQMKAQFPGGVETVTSGDFARMWAQRFYNQPVVASGAVPNNGTQPAAPGYSPAALSVDRLQMAQTYAQTSKGEVIAKITNDPFLIEHPAAMNAALSHANRMFEAQTADYADMERQLHVQEQQKKLISDATENEMLKQIYAPAPDAKPLTVSQIVNNDLLSRESKDRLIKQIGGSEEKDTKTYGAGFVHAMQMVHAPDGTPGRITDPQELYARLGPDGDLTYAGVSKLRDEINLKKSPEGSAEAEMKKQFLVNAKAQITGTDEGLHIKDPKGDELYLKFMAQVLPRYDEARRKGATPSQLLDPTSTDYIGKGLIDQPGHGFRRPMDQWFSDTIHDQPKDAAKPATFDINTVKSYEELTAAYNRGDVTGMQARQYGVAHGWVAGKPPPPQVPLSDPRAGRNY